MQFVQSKFGEIDNVKFLVSFTLETKEQELRFCFETFKIVCVPFLSNQIQCHLLAYL